MDSGRIPLIDQGQPRSSRACQACRTSKVRCRRPDENQSCSRCSEIGRPCVPREESNKRQKRVDSRYIDGVGARPDALNEVLQDRDTNASLSQATTSERTTTFGPPPAIILMDTNRPENSSSVISDEYFVAHIEQAIRDTIDEEKTSMIFGHFVENMLQHFPFVVFPPSTSAEVILQRTPILVLAILDAAGDGFYDTEVSRKLRRLLVKVYSTRLLETKLHSVSVLQALIITATWHKDLEAPEAGEQMDVFQISQSATNMATVLGMSNRTSSLEARRLWLACYYICSRYKLLKPLQNVASLVLQSPNVMRWTRYMDECLEVLSTSDTVLCAHVRLQHILEEFEAQLSTASSPTAIKVTCRVAKRQLAEWASVLNIWSGNCQHFILTELLSRRFVTLYVHELEMTTMPATNSALDPSSTKTTISAFNLRECVAAAHTSLDAFLSLDMSLIRALPTSHSVQVTHTAIMLVKLYFATTGLSNHEGPNLKADYYLERLVNKFSGWGTLWPAQKLSHTFWKLREMLQQRGNAEATTELAWLNTWTVEGILVIESVGPTSVTTDRPESNEAIPISRGLENAGGATLSTFDEESLAWSQAGIQSNVIQHTAHNTLPFASLDGTQLIDWFGTDLNTSTFDFDGNLQSLTQYFD
ncbi:hypothetical protein E4T44_04059 [Aureobasidium sp. EXF-8845]|nr:hypothetical protein E4T44_04059 [Aureobasidium sp. EXF-8845]KAI4854207.1 hypothetical protein E4T45_04050 [Aureobasidium sp. EXF-8846]